MAKKSSSNGKYCISRTHKLRVMLSRFSNQSNMLFVCDIAIHACHYAYSLAFLKWKNIRQGAKKKKSF